MEAIKVGDRVRVVVVPGDIPLCPVQCLATGTSLTGTVLAKTSFKKVLIRFDRPPECEGYTFFELDWWVLTGNLKRI